MCLGSLQAGQCGNQIGAKFWEVSSRSFIPSASPTFTGSACCAKPSPPHVAPQHLAGYTEVALSGFARNLEISQSKAIPYQHEPRAPAVDTNHRQYQ